LHPAAQSGGIGQARGILAVRHGLLSRIAGTDPVTGLLSTAQAVVPRRHQPVGQNREGPSARPTNPTPDPEVFTPVVVGLTKSPSVADDRGISAKRTSPRQAIQRNYPGSLLSFGSGSAINRTTAWRHRRCGGRAFSPSGKVRRVDRGVCAGTATTVHRTVSTIPPLQRAVLRDAIADEHEHRFVAARLSSSFLGLGVPLHNVWYRAVWRRCRRPLISMPQSSIEP